MARCWRSSAGATGPRPARGRCACGAVGLTVDGPLRPVTNCHCDRCRRITGHFLAATSAAVADLTVSDPDAMFARAVAAGARVVTAMTNAYGWRLGRVADPFGHDWEIGRPLK